ncbi:MAG: type 4a pilus biogenesis protein PilO [Planctomycetes bacterium]|nr:type 4a pilus biogenesis protein PilO [Planctomycetota bacterium]
MTATKERWMLIGTFVLAVLVMFCFAIPNYKTATTNVEEAKRLEDRINTLERRQVEVQNLRDEYESLVSQVEIDYKKVPAAPDTAQIVQALSLEVDGVHVLDQSFVAGSTTNQTTSEDSFSVQPLAITMEADFESIFSVIRQAESMGRLVRVSSVRITRPTGKTDSASAILEAAVGLHAPFNPMEGY